MSNVHTPRIGNPKKTTQHQGMMHGDTATSQSEWHTYGLLKTADAIEFYFDGQMTHRVKMSDIKGDNPFLDPNNNLVLKLNHMVGGSYLAKHDNWSDKTYVDASKFADDYKGGADGTDFSGSTMYVDYVRVYEPSTEADQPEPTPAPTPEQPAEPTPAPTPEQPTPAQTEDPVTPGNDDNATPSQPEQPATPAEPSNPGSNDNSNQEPPATKPDDSKPEPPATTKPDSDAAKPSTHAKPTPDKPSQPGNNGKPSTPAPSQPTIPAPTPSTPSTGNAQNGGDTSNSNGSTTTPAKPGNNQDSKGNKGSRDKDKPSRLANTGSSSWFRPIVVIWTSFWGWVTSWRFW